MIRIGRLIIAWSQYFWFQTYSEGAFMKRIPILHWTIIWEGRKKPSELKKHGTN